MSATSSLQRKVAFCFFKATCFWSSVTDDGVSFLIEASESASDVVAVSVDDASSYSDSRTQIAVVFVTFFV